MLEIMKRNKIEDMKKFIIFLVPAILFLTATTVSEAKVITLKKCNEGSTGDYNKAKKDYDWSGYLEFWDFVIDTEKKTVVSIDKISDKRWNSFSEAKRKEFKSQFTIVNYVITFSNNDYVTAEYLGNVVKEKLEIDLKKKFIRHSTDILGRPSESWHLCN
jgi:hypothetical protein